MNPATLALLDILATLDEAALSDCYGITRESAAPLDAALFAWIDAGRPDLGSVTPEAPADYTGPCHIEVLPEWRSGRGRYWLPNGHGYTDDVTKAGVFTAEFARGVQWRGGRSVAIKARPEPWSWKPVGPDCYDLVTPSGNVRATIGRDGFGWRPSVPGRGPCRWADGLASAVTQLRGVLGADVPDVPRG